MCSTRVAATSAIFLNRNFWKNTNNQRSVFIFWRFHFYLFSKSPVPLFAALLLFCCYPVSWQAPRSLSESCWQPSLPDIIMMSPQDIWSIITLANVAHCFSTSCAWLKLFGFSRTTVVDFSAELSQGINWWLRPQRWNSIWIETSNNHNFWHEPIIVIHHLL